jgi:hypothetical protein
MRFLKWLLRPIYDLLIGWLIGLITWLLGWLRDFTQRQDLRRANHIYTRCQVIPASIYKRPDPLIYSQDYLMSQGLAVTWDNPDIQLFDLGGTPVASTALLPDTEYDVTATIYNGSTEAWAVNMPVDFSYLSFGIGGKSNPIGRVIVPMLPVKGAIGHPVRGTQRWRTPPTPGHYCLQVRLIWTDDANPHNNLGQENTNVGIAASPAVFEFPVANNTQGIEQIALEADSYTLQQPIDCERVATAEASLRDDATGAVLEGRELCEFLARRHAQGQFPIPAGWTVTIEPQAFELAPGGSKLVKVTITPPDSFHGTQAVNVNAFDRQHVLIGGVTLYTQR